MCNYIISQMCKFDVEAISVIERETFSQPWSKRSIEEELTNPNSVFFTAKSDGVLLGYIGCHVAANEGYIDNIAVKDNYRNLGIGGALIDYLIGYARKNDFEFLTLEVRKSNERAIRLYRNKGFVLAGERKNFYSNPTENAEIYTLYFKE